MPETFDIFVERAVPSGALILSTFVSDGAMTWRHVEQFFDYSNEESCAIFAQHIDNNGWKTV